MPFCAKASDCSGVALLASPSGAGCTGYLLEMAFSDHFGLFFWDQVTSFILFVILYYCNIFRVLQKIGLGLFFSKVFTSAALPLPLFPMMSAARSGRLLGNEQIFQLLKDENWAFCVSAKSWWFGKKTFILGHIGAKLGYSALPFDCIRLGRYSQESWGSAEHIDSKFHYTLGPN